MVKTFRSIKDALDAADERGRKRGHDGLTEHELGIIARAQVRSHGYALAGHKLPETPFKRRKRRKPND